MNSLLAVLLIIIMPMLLAPASFAAETPKSADSSDLAKKRIERERQFLYRSVEDLNKSQGYVQATVRGLEKQIDAVDAVEPSRKEKDIASFLEWYRSYTEWLGSNLAEVEADLSRAYSDEQGGIVQPERFYSLVEGYARLGSQLEEQLFRLDKLNDRTIQRIENLRTALEYVTSVAFIEERNREKKQHEQGNDPWNNQRRDELYERYKNTTDIEIAMMQREQKNLDELQKHFLVLIEMGRMELSWITRKTGDYDALGRLASAINRNTPASIEEASNRVAKLYDSDIVYFKKKTEEISRARSRVVPTGSMRALDSMEELSENYGQMKSRYEHHITWLAEQAGAYQADVIELRKDK